MPLQSWISFYIYHPPSSLPFLPNIVELDALEADMEFESAAVPSYLQPDEEPDLNLPAAPSYPTAVPLNRHQVSEFHVHVQKNAICTAFLT
jgi:charged multivesicular body protein 5